MIKRTGISKAGTAVLGLAIIGTTVGGFAGVGSVRTSQAHHRAAVAAARAKAAADAAKAAEDKAKSDYAAAVQTVASDVLANVQPMERVLRGLDTYHPGVVFAIQDALSRAGVSQQLQADVDHLQAIHAPASVSADATDLVRRAGDLHASFASLAGAVSRSTDKGLFDVLTGDKVDQLRESEQEWHTSLATLYSHLNATTPGAPSASGGWAGPGTVPTATKATWIARADEACGQAEYSLSKLPTGHDLASGTTFQMGWAAANKQLAHDLRAIPKPAADAAHLQSAITDHLTVLDNAARDGAAAGRAMKARDYNAATDAFDRVDADVALTKPLERGFRSYGAMLCADFFSPAPSSSSSGSTSSPSGLNT